MCGRYVFFASEEYLDMISILNDIDEKYNNYKVVDVFPTDKAPILALNKENKVKPFILRWGFPFNNKLIINARSETLLEKKTFKYIINKGKCLIPAIGFYEWKKNKDQKQKYLIKIQKKKVFYMAGLYKKCIDKKGNSFPGYVIITTKASDKMADIHDRMPVILDDERKKIWLYEKNPSQKFLDEILTDYDKLDIIKSHK